MCRTKHPWAPSSGWESSRARVAVASTGNKLNGYLIALYCGEDLVPALVGLVRFKVIGLQL